MAPLPSESRRFRLWLPVLCVCVLAGGCPPADHPPVPEESRIKGLSVLYGQYLSKHRGEAPPSEAEFKKFISSMNKDALEGEGIDPSKIDELFISPRDNQPYGIAYKLKNAGMPGPDGKAPTVIWERVGSGGQRYTATSLGAIELLNEEQFKQRVPNPG